MFGLLDDDDEVGGQEVEVNVANKKDGNVDLEVTTGQSEAGGDSAAWTDVSSTKNRRLAPQWASTKQESPAASSTPTGDISKKKGIVVRIFFQDCPHQFISLIPLLVVTSHTLHSAAFHSRGYHGTAQAYSGAR